MEFGRNEELIVGGIIFSYIFFAINYFNFNKKNVMVSVVNMKTGKVKILIYLLIIAITVPIIVFFVSPFLALEIYRGEDEKTVWVKIWGLPLKNEISGTDSYKDSGLEWSPNKSHLAFYDFVREKIYDKEWFLKVYNPRFFQVKTVFIGDYRTSAFKWLDDSTIRVYVSAGSGVRIYRDININEAGPFIAAEHESPAYWVPEKTF